MNAPTVGALSSVLVLAGIGIPVMAALNGALGVRIGNPVLAATILFALALISSLMVLLIQAGPITFDIQVVPRQDFAGGFLVAFYVLSVTYVAPKLGVGNAIVLVLLGQTLALATIDQFGWFGAPKASLTPTRGLRLLLIIAGVLLTRRTIDVQ